ncbi:hypothetical protein OAO01_07445 [Oligoflexia bacterium]|nr:hypothetical protein [Oligoflexia bacterium]
MNKFKKIENEILDVQVSVLERYAVDFANMGITYSRPLIEVWRSSHDEYESEFRIVFYKNEKFLDVIENHIFREGRQLASIEEYESWIEDAVVELLKVNTK